MQTVINHKYISWGDKNTEDVGSPRVLNRVIFPILVGTLSLFYRKDLADKKADAVFEKLSRIEELPDNWNGYGAVPISKDVILNTRMLLGYVSVKPEVFPVSDGSIQIEYDRVDGAYLEIHIETGNRYSSFLVDTDGNEYTEESISFAEVIVKINGFVKS